MDKSERYQKMCKAAWQEIGYIPPKDALLPSVVLLSNGDLHAAMFQTVWSAADAPDRYPVGQLYRQDQLQALSGLPWRAFDMLCLEMVNKGGSAEYIETKEQVGIMAVMALNHNKVWDGEGWERGGE